MNSHPSRTPAPYGLKNSNVVSNRYNIIKTGHLFLAEEKQRDFYTEVDSDAAIHFDGQKLSERLKSALSLRYDSAHASDENHRDRLFLQLLLGLSANLAVLIATFYFLFPLTEEGRTVGGILLWACLAALVSITVTFLKFGMRIYCVNLLLSGLCVVLVSACFWLDGVMSPTMIFMMTLPVLAATITDSRWAVFWTVAIVASWGTILVLQNNGVEMDRVTHLANAQSIQVLALLGTAFMIMSMLGSYVASNGRLRETMELKNERLDYLASHDPLTSIPNRRALFEQAQQCLLRSARSGKPFALLVIDLNDFKKINDTLGHSTGDAVLQHFADRLKHGFRETDFVARMGGDEFAVVLEPVESYDSVQLAVDRFFKLGDNEVKIDGQLIQYGCSTGIAMYPENGEHVISLYDEADAAMYRAKRESPVQFAWR